MNKESFKKYTLGITIGAFLLPLFLYSKFEAHLWNIELCMSYRFTKAFSLLSNALVNVSIALERFRCVFVRGVNKKWISLLNIFGFYLVSVIVASFEIANAKIIHKHVDNQTEVFRCDNDHLMPEYFKIGHSIIYILLTSFVPVSLVIYFNAKLLREFGKERLPNKSARKRKLFTSCRAIIIIMTVCNLPYSILMTFEYYLDIDSISYFNFLIDFAIILNATHAFLILFPYAYLLPKSFLNS
jgi:hypothetical protein